MARLIMLHGLVPESLEKFVFYLDADSVEAVIPADKEQQQLGYRSTVIVKGGTEENTHGYDVTETLKTVVKRVNGTDSKDETETE